MLDVKRSQHNPILSPDKDDAWESESVFNGSVVKDEQTFHMLYRAQSSEQEHLGRHLELSTIGHATSTDGIVFNNRNQFLTPTEDWEKFGCEDPRITKIDDEYFVFYTALADFPFYPLAIKIALATFTSFDGKIEKHLVTPFNAKAMVLFPEKINGKYAALLTLHTDIPPAYIAYAEFETKEEMYSQIYWKKWYENFPDHILELHRTNSDQIEVGAVPVKTEKGWILTYAHIQHYYNEEHRIFGIETALLDLSDPKKIIGRTQKPIMVPQESYEKEGKVKNVIFPSGMLAENDTLSLYYGATDTTCCVATLSKDELVNEMLRTPPVAIKATKIFPQPLLAPIEKNAWEKKAVFNPATYFDGTNTHIVYRAMGDDNTSVMGYAKSKDFVTIDERLNNPIYEPREDFESKKVPGGNSGCEDPRITKIDDTLYMCYTAFDGIGPPRVALTSILEKDFIEKKFSWSKPILISPPGIDDKDAAIFPEKVNGKYCVIHRIQNAIVFDFVENLEFANENWLRSISYIPPRGDEWDSEKIGLCSPPIKTDGGWLMLYHGVSKRSHEYRVGALLVDLTDPSKVLSRTPWPILEPVTKFEREGIVNNVVFPCGTALDGDNLYIYYGGADKVVCVAKISLKLLLIYMTET